MWDAYLAQQMEDRNDKQLRDGEFLVVLCEVDTGIVVDKHGVRVVRDRWSDHRLSGGESRFVFQSVEEARSFARRVVSEHPHVEYWLSDCHGASVEDYRNEEYIEELVAKQRALRLAYENSWWRRLKNWLGF